MNIFLICPIKKASPETQNELQKYVEQLEEGGHTVYYPRRDTNQTDPVGINIITENKSGLSKCDEVHIWYDKNSKGSVFDLGMAWYANKKLVIANPESLSETEGKSFENIILNWNKNYR